MCIIFYTTSHPSYSLILAANRDEFLSRPTTEATWHDFTTTSPSSQPTTANRNLCGLDLSGGGTWLGVALPAEENLGATGSSSRTRLRFATLTNYTEVVPEDGVIRPSRGELVKDFLQAGNPPAATVSSSSVSQLEDYLARLENHKSSYSGFNLLCGELSNDGTFHMGYISNRSEKGAISSLPPMSKDEEEVVGLSNSTLVEGQMQGSEWSKIVDGCEEFRKVMRRSKEAAGVEEENMLVKSLWEILKTSNPNPVTSRHALRTTILVKPIQINLSAPLPPSNPSLPIIKQKGDWYATRTQTILLIDKQGKVTFLERDAFVEDERGEAVWSGKTRRFEFEV